MRSLGGYGFPEAVLAHLAGLPVRRRRGTRSPGKASAATGGEYAKPRWVRLPGGGAGAPVRATGPQTAGNP
ncbi:hypothetical protein [Klebsiella grimontii]|uniref:hypothetical protein n=1 Tax=Klebsiella grimontii TaxID=2058152 RepID=UPI001EC21BBD|nr:hypothetical protein [Klebsiella grimontii]MBZ7402591.1 hypothetical protein [Klebsiella grimontii]MDM6726373.1 hypothetical protein [Klebsiella grimontii]MDV1023693.1 hypothetical protein [Klebsiella grimontii]MDV1040264.1 hypothetical protein [Klebsiella grimontii]MDV1104536.1 hypothetical protein [Klebsiella grimontii]